MKRIIFPVFFIHFWICCYSQVPHAFMHQMIVTDDAGAVLPNTLVNVRLSLLEDGPAGNLAYSEIATTFTSGQGQLNLKVGTNYPVAGSFNNIHWGQHTMYLRVEFRPEGQNQYEWAETRPLLSVPYAFYAGSSNHTYAAGTGIHIENQTISLQHPNQWILNNGTLSHMNGKTAMANFSTEGNRDPSAIVDVNSTSRGLGLPCLTTVQRDAIPNPRIGLMIYNVTTQCLNTWNGTIWDAICATGSIPEPDPSNGSQGQ